MLIKYSMKYSLALDIIILIRRDKIRRVCDLRNFDSGVFLDSQKPFNTASHDIVLKELEYYGIRGVTNNRFHSYLNDRMQFTTVNKCQS